MGLLKDSTKEKIAKFFVFKARRFRLKKAETYFWLYRYEIARLRKESIMSATNIATSEVLRRRKVLETELSNEET